MKRSQSELSRNAERQKIFFLNFKSFYLDRICEDNSYKAHGIRRDCVSELATNETEFVGIRHNSFGVDRILGNIQNSVCCAPFHCHILNCALFKCHQIKL